MNWATYFEGLVACLALAFTTWLISVFKRDVSIVDSVWSLLFVGAAMVYLNETLIKELVEIGTREWLIFALLIIWALRLALHITYRSWGEAEDHRYQVIREKYSPGFAFKSLFIIFTFQAILAWVLTLSLFMVFTQPAELDLMVVIGCVIIISGILFESIADWQLHKFKSNPANRGKVMNQGLWRYSRHPNYFGEAIVWWGFGLFAIAQGHWWAVTSPLLLTFMLLRFSGVSLLESSIVERRPAYRHYMLTTNAFIPGPQKNSKKADAKGHI